MSVRASAGPPRCSALISAWATGLRPLKAAVALMAVVLTAAAPVASATTLRWSATSRVDTRLPVGHGHGVFGVACPTSSLCIGSDNAGSLRISTDPSDRRSWKKLSVDPGRMLNGLACTSASMCSAFDDAGNVLISTDPTGGPAAWHLEHIGLSASGTAPGSVIESLVCPSASLCVAGDQHGVVFTSTNPAGGASTWHHSIPMNRRALGGMVCPSTGLCLVVSGSKLFTSTDPAGGAGAWKPDSSFPSGGSLISCPSASVCFGTTGRHLLVSTDPAGGIWKSIHPKADPIACPSANLCIGTTGTRGSASVWALPSPASSSSHWRLQRTYPGYVNGLTCFSFSLCEGFDSTNRVFASSNPTGGRSAWSAPRALKPPECPKGLGRRCVLFAPPVVSCASRSLCALGDYQGNLFVTRTPMKPRSWRVMFADGSTAITSLACGSARLCGGIDDAGRVLASVRPRPRGRDWKVLPRNVRSSGVACAPRSFCVVWLSSPYYPGDQLGLLHARGRRFRSERTYLPVVNGMSCPSTGLCVATTRASSSRGEHAAVRVSTDPSASRSVWHTVARATGRVACPSVHLCVVATSHGQIVSSTDPLGGRETWHRVDVSSAHHRLVALSCPTTRLCVAAGAHGLYVSHRPAARSGAWKHVATAFAGKLTSLACSRASLCLVASTNGEVYRSTRPAVAHSWSPTRPFARGFVSSIACPTARRCLLGSSTGSMIAARLAR